MISLKNLLNIVSWNTTSVRNKANELHEYSIDHSTDIVIITEIWLIRN